MRTFTQNFLNERNTIKRFLIVLTILLAIVGIYVYNTTYYVVVRFNELGPLSKNMAVYYNGFKIGKIVNIGPDKDFKHTLVKISLTPQGLDLPQNIIVNVQRFPNGELYLQFVYPQSPSLRNLKRGDVLEGIAPYSLEQFMLGQNISGVTDIVSLHIIKALNAADAANQEMELFFRVTSKMIKENGKGISASVNNTAVMTQNLSQAAQNLNQITKKLNDALDAESLKSTTSNVKEVTQNVAVATKDLDKTIKKIDDTIVQANAAAENMNSITSGLNVALGKRFGGMRVMFGKPVGPKNCVKNACK